MEGERRKRGEGREGEGEGEGEGVGREGKEEVTIDMAAFEALPQPPRNGHLLSMTAIIVYIIIIHV